ncbi:MAG: sigma-70 family RNA polymerase sigma factor, partial [Oscillospiraceae bacterium]|nr:sigma-70 family RNA polymerase sigma factor [Oscillospiraceae bacterium]
MNKLKIKLNQLFSLIKKKLGISEIHYINGPQTLPPPLKKEEEFEIMQRIEQGDEKAREPLITHNLRLVVYIARKFEASGVGVEDLVSIGTIGLIKAVNTFCPSKKIKLATYASRCIENEILMYLRKINAVKFEISIDEPLNIDWDGNELLLSDILGSEPDTVNRDIEYEDEKKLLYETIENLS